MRKIIMPFGKYKGKAIEELPSDYLFWMAENMADEQLCEAADKEYQERTKFNEHWYED